MIIFCASWGINDKFCDLSYDMSEELHYIDFKQIFQGRYPHRPFGMVALSRRRYAPTVSKVCT